MKLSSCPATFPESAYQQRYRSFLKTKEQICGIGCAYNCCDPIITSMVIPRSIAEAGLRNSMNNAAENLRKDIEGDRRLLTLAGFFLAPFFFKDCFVEGLDFGINNSPEKNIQCYILFGCPHLTDEGLCSIYGGTRFGLCERFKGCPEHCVKDSMPESSFLTLAYNYWLMRRLILLSTVDDISEAIAAWGINEQEGIRSFLRSRSIVTDLIDNRILD